MPVSICIVILQTIY